MTSSRPRSAGSGTGASRTTPIPRAAGPARSTKTSMAPAAPISATRTATSWKSSRRSQENQPERGVHGSPGSRRLWGRLTIPSKESGNGSEPSRDAAARAHHACGQRAHAGGAQPSVRDANKREPDAHLLHRPQEREGLPAAGQLRARRRRAAHSRRRPLDAEPGYRTAGPDPAARPPGDRPAGTGHRPRGGGAAARRHRRKESRSHPVHPDPAPPRRAPGPRRPRRRAAPRLLHRPLAPDATGMTPGQTTGLARLAAASGGTEGFPK